MTQEHEIEKATWGDLILLAIVAGGGIMLGLFIWAVVEMFKPHP